MPPPPVTPSPHRFLTAPNPQQPPPKSLQASQFRPSAAQLPQEEPTPRFASAPRFSFSAKVKHPPFQAPRHSFSSPLPALPRRPPHLPLTNPIPIKNKEDIEDTETETSFELRLRSRPPGSQEEEGEEGEGDLGASANATSSLSPAHKRRRIHPASPDAISSTSCSGASSSSSPSLRSISPPPRPPKPAPANLSSFASPRPTTRAPQTPKFVLTPQIQSLSTSRPPLLLPPRSPSPPPAAAAAPLHPAFFSPQRRGQKFVAGGMASTVRGWVLEAAGNVQHQGTATAVRIRDVKGEGERVVLVEEGEDEGRKGWVLVGPGGRNGGEELRPGMLVKVGRPSWEVEVDGRRWGVGVDWEQEKEGKG